jgi:hypothetical protein
MDRLRRGAVGDARQHALQFRDAGEQRGAFVHGGDDERGVFFERFSDIRVAEFCDAMNIAPAVAVAGI